MSTESPSIDTATVSPVSPWATGLVVFAGAVMIVSGIIELFVGFAAVLHDQIYVATPAYTYAFDLTAWGWVHLLIGVLVALVGVAVLSGKSWGRWAGIGLVALSAIANFMFLPHYPLWSILLIVLDVAVIWALAVSDRSPA